MKIYFLALSYFIHSLQAMSSLEQASKRLFSGINPIKRLALHELQKEFFIEKAKGVAVERINDRMLYVHDSRVEEKERSFPAKEREKEFALLKQVNGKVVDRRSVVEDHLDSPYMAISFLRAIYNITPHDEIIFNGTGFRNGLNQIVTAGHNLYIDEDLIRKTCKNKKIPLKDYSFNKKI